MAELTKSTTKRIPSHIEVRLNYGRASYTEAVRQIERHVDHAHAYVIYDIECAHCGLDPEPDEAGIPCCCGPAVDEAEAAIAKATP